MRAVVVYESMYGNTHLIADAIGVGLKSRFDITIVPVSQASPAVLADADLVVVGGPTHIHAMSRAATRKAAVEAASKPVSPLQVEPDAPGPGLREWFGSLGRYPVKAAAFDTRLHGHAALTGRAAKGITRLLRAHGFDVVAEPESFLVTKQDRLVPDELDRAREWGTNLAADIARPTRTVPGELVQAGPAAGSRRGPRVLPHGPATPDRPGRRHGRPADRPFGPKVREVRLYRPERHSPDAWTMNPRFPLTGAERSAPESGGAPWDDILPTSSAWREDRACCCPAPPVVRVIMPPTVERRHSVDLLLCGHHYRVSRQAVTAAGARIENLPGKAEAAAAALLEIPCPDHADAT